MERENSDESLQWYVVQTKPKGESRAEGNLNAWMVETFTPLLKEPRHGRCSGKLMYVVKPLFPNYIFARFNAKNLLHKVQYTRGVRKVVSFGSAPAPIDDRIISIIKSRVSGDGFVRLVESFGCGDEVLIKGGPLKGLSGIFERETKDSGRVMILLTTISYQSHLVIERELLEKR